MLINGIEYNGKITNIPPYTRKRPAVRDFVAEVYAMGANNGLISIRDFYKVHGRYPQVGELFDEDKNKLTYGYAAWKMENKRQEVMVGATIHFGFSVDPIAYENAWY
jgi:hypothetical protein